MTYDDDAQERTRGLLRLNSETYRHFSEEQMGDDQAFSKPPFFIMWVPPHGHVVAAPDAALAQRGAAHFAGKNPGQVAAVYQLVGYAYTPLKPAPFLPAPEPSLIEAAAAAAETAANEATED